MEALTEYFYNPNLLHVENNIVESCLKELEFKDEAIKKMMSLFWRNSNVSLFSTNIKEKYRLLSLKYHPSLSLDANAETRFKKISKAYAEITNILKDYPRKVLGQHAQLEEKITIDESLKNALFAYYEKRNGKLPRVIKKNWDESTISEDEANQVQAILHDTLKLVECIIVKPQKTNSSFTKIYATTGNVIAIEDFLKSIRDYELTEAMKHGFAFNISIEQAKQACEHLKITVSEPIEPHIVSSAFCALLHLPSNNGIIAAPNGQGYTIYIKEKVKDEVEDAMSKSVKLGEIFKKGLSLETKGWKGNWSYKFNINEDVTSRLTKIEPHSSLSSAFEKLLSLSSSNDIEVSRIEGNDYHRKFNNVVTYNVNVNTEIKNILTNRLKVKEIFNLKYPFSLKKSDNGDLFKNEEELTTKLVNKLTRIVDYKPMSPLGLFGVNLNEFIPKVMTAFQKGDNNELQRLCSELEKGRGYSEKSPTGQAMVAAIHQALEDKIKAILESAEQVLSSNNKGNESIYYPCGSSSEG